MLELLTKLAYAEDFEPNHFPVANWVFIVVIAITSVLLMDKTGELESGVMMWLSLNEWRQILFSHFVHIDIVHLALNLFGLWLFGGMIGGCMHTIPYLVLCVVLAIVSGFAQNLYSGSYGVGASGIIYGLIGFCIVQLGDVKLRFPIYFDESVPLWTIAMIWVFGDVVGALFLRHLNIGFMSHVAGFAAGVIAALLVLILDRKKQ